MKFDDSKTIVHDRQNLENVEQFLHFCISEAALANTIRKQWSNA